MTLNVTLALDQHIEAELAEAREAASKAMADTVAAYRLVTELELARDLRKSLGAELKPVASLQLSKDRVMIGSA